MQENQDAARAACENIPHQKLCKRGTKIENAQFENCDCNHKTLKLCVRK